MKQVTVPVLVTINDDDEELPQREAEEAAGEYVKAALGLLRTTSVTMEVGDLSKAKK